MRVTTAGQTHAIITRLLDGQRRLAEAQQRATSGLRVEKASDDPTAASAVMQAGGGVRGVAQYTRNAERAGATLDAEDSALQQLSALLDRAKELGVLANSDTADADARASAGKEVSELLNQAVALGNTKFGDDYLFGGLTSDGRPPFDAAAASFVPLDGAVPRFPDGTRDVEVGAGGQRLAGAHDGTTVFLGRANGAPSASAGVLPALRQLAGALAGGAAAAVAPALAAVDDAITGLQATVGELGARQNTVDSVRSGLAALDATLTQRKSDLSEIDAEQAITELLARQTAYQAAMLASSKVMGLSLADYLR